MKEYRLIFGIQFLQLGNDNYYYSEPFVCDMLKDRPTYMFKNGVEEVIASCNIILSEEEKQLLTLCKEMHPVNIVVPINGGSKKPKPIEVLWHDDELKKRIISINSRLMKQFLELVPSTTSHLYVNVQRKVFLQDIEINASAIQLDAVAILDKTAIGANYHLGLFYNNEAIVPSQSESYLICQTACYIIVDYKLYYVAAIDGKKLIPFLAKEHIYVNQRMLKQYFNSFIKDLVGKVEMQAIGFEYESITTNPSASIKWSENTFANRYELILTFDYKECKFIYGDKANHRVFISIDDKDEISVRKIVRSNVEEQNVINLFERWGLTTSDAKRFYFESIEEDLFYSYNELLKYRDALEQNGIIFPELIINDKVVVKYIPSIELEYVAKDRDWFDVNAIIKVGDNLLSFKMLMQHIRKENRYFLMKDGGLFIIPAEWMSKYKLLASFANLDVEQVRLPKANYPVLEEVAGKAIEASKAEKEKSIQEVIIPTTLHATLRPYQAKGAKWLINHYQEGLGACLADDMGLGKTVQTIAALLHAKEDIKAINTGTQTNSPRQLSLFEDYTTARKSLCSLVVLPSSLIFNWQLELQKFAPSLITTKHIGTKRSKKASDLKHFDIILTTYQTALRDEALLSQIEFTYIVLDESHSIKNKDSAVFKTLHGLKSKARISLSGTPIENSLSDLWAQMEFINPEILGSFSFFKSNFQLPIEKAKDERKIASLKVMLDPFILRRTKNEVVKDLPELDEQIYYTEMTPSQSKYYEEQKSMVRNQLLDANYDLNTQRINVLNALMKLRQIANAPILVDEKIDGGKFEDVTDVIREISRSNNKVLVFSNFVGHLRLYEAYLKSNNIGYAILTGESSQAERVQAVNRFSKEADCTVFLMSIKAGGVGLNLTAANYVIILDPWWNPFVERQAIARSHRIGQENKVNCIRFITKNTIEEKIIQLQAQKLQLASNFIEVGDLPDLDYNNLAYLLD